jgi:hypothetical protein
MAQPDLGRLAEAFQIATNEIVLLGNLPSIHDRQAAHNNHQQLVGLIQHLTTRVDTVERGLNTRLDTVERRVEQGLNDLNMRLDHLDARITVK